MSRGHVRLRLCAAAVPTLVLSLIGLAPGAQASGTPRISPPIVAANVGQLFTLVVEPEQEGAIVTMVELYPPPDFEIDSFAPSPGWHRDWSIRSQLGTVQKATWTREELPKGDEEIEDATEQDALFQFVATPRSSKSYSFEVRQTYADGSVIHWREGESVAFPASPGNATIRQEPTVLARSSLGSGESRLAAVALIVGALGLAVAAVSILALRRGRAGGRM
jgi:hypothetical protein